MCVCGDKIGQNRFSILDARAGLYGHSDINCPKTKNTLHTILLVGRPN